MAPSNTSNRAGGGWLRPQVLALLIVAIAAPTSAASRALRQAPGEVSVAGKALVISVSMPDGSNQRAVLLHTRQGRRLHLEDAKPGMTARLSTGMDVTAWGRWLRADGGTAPTRFLASRVQATGGKRMPAPMLMRPPRGDGAVASTAAAAGVRASGDAPVRLALTANIQVQRDISAIVVPIAAVAPDGGACPGTSPPASSVNDVKRAVFAEANRNGSGPSVGGLFGSCSYGKARLTTANSLVVPLVKLPCEGVSNGVPWSFATCGYDDFSGYADAADAALQARGVVLGRYTYRVYLIPPSACGFVGLAYVGCDGSFLCRAWIGAGFWDSPSAIAHELGHNLFLGHAGAPRPDGTIDEYGDTSSIMGYCCDNRCPNTPQAWQLGWATLQQLDAGSLRPGQTVQLRLASQAAAQQSGLRVDVASWVAGVDPVFVGFRTTERGDRGLTPEVAGRVSVHTAPTLNSVDSRPTVLRAYLAPGQSWTQPASGLVVRLRSRDDGGALVSVCRRGGAETVASCSAGTDNDCNGLAGLDDPACSSLMRLGLGRERQNKG